MAGLFIACLAGNLPARAASGSFEQSLASDYHALSTAEYAQGDGRDGATYAARALAAEQGKATAPEAPGLRQAFLKGHYLEALGSAHDHLLKSLDAGGRSNAPAAAARAQSSFDCWLEQASEDIQPDDIEACRKSFLTALAIVDQATAPAPVAQAEPPATPPTPTTTPPPEVINYRVYFGFDKSAITRESAATLDEVKAATDVTRATHIKVVGHASSIGDRNHNQALSQRRADAVKAALIKLDVHADGIEAIARGEDDQLVPTADGVREPRNRQVYIIID